jgi:predicted regulator of Ras-like GTPase activity (Roadblock/LC7/MglB family)
MEVYLSRKLNILLEEMALQVPGILGIGIVGNDGLVIAQHSSIAHFDLEAAGAQLSLVIKLVQKIARSLTTKVEDELIISPEILFLMSVLGDDENFLIIAAQKDVTRLGNLRFAVSQYISRLREAIPMPVMQS